MDLSIVIPAYNEEKRISGTIEDVLDYFNQTSLSFELIVVNDGSTDRTEHLINPFAENLRLVTYSKNMGKGYAVKRGVMAATGKYIIFTDADMAFDCTEIHRLYLKAVQNACHILIGKRKRVLNCPKERSIGSALFKGYVNLLLKSGEIDTQSGIKCFRSDIAKKLFEKLTIFDFAFDIEILFMAHKTGYTISQTEVVARYKEGSKVSFLKDGGKMVSDVIKIKSKDILGKYEGN